MNFKIERVGEKQSKHPISWGVLSIVSNVSTDSKS